ncbi:hypothetical protein [Actinopolymorpha singaporensis]|nr:hypothetical protein [Actinopolymorpha singaporensis]
MSRHDPGMPTWAWVLLVVCICLPVLTFIVMMAVFVSMAGDP